MRKCVLLVAFLCGSVALTALPNKAQAQGVATYSKEAMDSLGGLLKKAGKDGFTMEAKATTIFGGWLPKGKGDDSPWITILVLPNLSPDKMYRVIGAGDNDTKDLDIRVVDPDGKVVVTDTATARNAEVTFQPARSQEYSIQMRLYDSADNCICIGAVLRK